MTRIKDIPGFYDRLHAIERLYIEDPRDEDSRMLYGLKHTNADHPDLMSLRHDMGIPSQSSARNSYVQNEQVDWDLLFKRMAQLRMYQKDVANKIGMSKATWSNKYHGSRFTKMEIRKMEEVMNFKKGKLYPIKS